MYTAFIDFKAAYDSVPRDRLVERLAECGLHGRFLEAVAGLYWQAALRAKVGG